VSPLRFGQRADGGAASEAAVPIQLLRAVALGEAVGGVVRQVGGQFEQSAQVAGVVRGTGAAAAPLRTPQVAAAAAAPSSAAPASPAVFTKGVHEVFAGGAEEDYSVGATGGPSSQT
jgi:hypothetical protein